MLLKLYVYGYLDRIRSIRTLEREANRYVEVMWLTGKLAPDFLARTLGKTIADFRRHNRAALQIRRVRDDRWLTHTRSDQYQPTLATACSRLQVPCPSLAVIDAYLNERDDTSPWIFVQNGRTGSPPRGRQLSTETYRRRRRGYGARLGLGSVRWIVMEVASKAGYKSERDHFISTHAFHYWHAQRHIDLGASIDQLQAVLGHARAQTTKNVYAPEPNVSQILEWEHRIQRSGVD